MGAKLLKKMIYLSKSFKKSIIQFSLYCKNLANYMQSIGRQIRRSWSIVQKDSENDMISI